MNNIDQETKDEIDKKIKVLMSRFTDETVYCRNKLIDSILVFFSQIWYKITVRAYYNIKYFIQRHTRGYDDLDKWNAAWYIARKAIPVLKAMKNSFVGTSVKWHREDRFGNIIELSKDEVFVDDGAPACFTEDEWRAILDDIIYAFQFPLDTDRDAFDEGKGLFVEYNQEKYDAAYKRHKRGLKLFSIYYMNLWD